MFSAFLRKMRSPDEAKRTGSKTALSVSPDGVAQASIPGGRAVCYLNSTLLPSGQSDSILEHKGQGQGIPPSTDADRNTRSERASYFPEGGRAAYLSRIVIFRFGNWTYLFQLEENGTRMQYTMTVLVTLPAARRGTCSEEASAKREPEQTALAKLIMIIRTMTSHDLRGRDVMMPLCAVHSSGTVAAIGNFNDDNIRKFGLQAENCDHGR
ncbi:hypothetical protein EDB84DRAFT_1441420 [Lactarius hengduanensis]|nr:hypothetical protein EDB84DRAFT_1441420 [Lactarius hengduanensis]